MTIKIRKGMVRADDYETSIAGAEAVTFRAGSQKHRLLSVYYAYPEGLNDEEAAVYASLTRTCYWKRCGELRQDGLIEDTGQTSTGEAGVERIVCRITPKGREVYRRLA
jgi:hypothetical protein